MNAPRRPSLGAAHRVLWLFLVLARCLAADPEPIPHADYLVRNWSTLDGLPNNTVRAIIQGRDGYMWIATAGGLCRFDGLRFRSFTAQNTPAFLSDDLYSLIEDREGRIWISSGRGVLVLDKDQIQAVGPDQGLANGAAAGLYLDHEGTVWVHDSIGLHRRVGSRFEKIPSPSEPIDSTVDASGRVWALSSDGFYRWNGSHMERVPGSTAADTFTIDASGVIWLLRYPNTLLRLVGDRLETMPSPGPGWFQTIHATPGGDVWIGVRVGSGVVRYRDGQRHVVDSASGLHGARPVCFFEDRGGNLWIGSNRGGLFRLREPRLRLYRSGHDIPAGATISLAPDAAGTLHLSIMGAGLLAFDGAAFRPVSTGDPRSPLFLATSLAPARDSGIWIGNLFRGLRPWSGNRLGPPAGIEGGTRALLVDRSKRLWRATVSHGLECHEESGIRRFQKTNGLSSDALTALAESNDGAIWIGTERGLNRLHEGRIDQFDTRDGLGHPWIRALCIDHFGSLWVGTAGGGLSVWRDGRFLTLGVAEGLPHGRVEILLDDGRGSLWAGTPVGIVRLALKDLHAFANREVRTVHGTIFGAEDGLPVPQFGSGFHPAATVDRAGKLWFCSDSGVVHIDPATLPPTAPAPVIRLEEAWIDGQRIPLAGEPVPLDFPPGAERLEIAYTGLEFSAPDRIRFRYLLEGSDEEWIDAGPERLARYTRLRPGTYHFRVMAANNDGAWSQPTPGLRIVVHPTLRQTLWFQAGLACAVTAAGFLILRIRLTAIERRRAADASFTRQLIESQERERSRIADELHDSLGHGLLVIKNRASLATANAADTERVTRDLREVSDIATEAIREVRSIARNLRPFQLDELGLTKSITASLRTLADSSEIEFHASLDPVDDALAPDDRIHFYRIVQECLNNIVKHSRARNATVGLRWSERLLRLTVTDDGCGFAPPDPEMIASAGFGLGSIAQRTRTLGGHVSYDSTPGQGTRVVVEVPASRPRPESLAGSHTQTFRRSPA